MMTGITLALALAATSAALAAEAPVLPPSEVVWRWLKPCSADHTMKLDVVLDAKSLYSAVVPVCKMQRADVPDEFQVREFTFRAPAVIFGGEFAHLGTPEIEGNIWQAGGESRQLLFGASFVVPGRILLNAIHVAETRTGSRTTLAKGLVIKTSAVRK